MSQMKSLIQKLCETPGPPGYEAEVRQVVRAEVEAYADEVCVDALGNLIVRQGRKQAGGRRVLAAAHMDEPGVMVRHIDAQGFARLEPLGERAAREWAGRPVRFLNGATGVVSARETKKELAFDQLALDLGRQDAASCPVKTGDAAVLAMPFTDLGERVSAAALNPRAGVAVLIELLRQRTVRAGDELAAVFCAQGQVGGRGVGAAAFDLQPDLALVIETMAEGDSQEGPRLGSGPVALVRANNLIIDPRVLNWITENAENAGIPRQACITPVSSAGLLIQQSREGVLVGVIALPCRYPGTGIEMVDLGDVENTLQLAAALVNAPI